jgi:F-type H+-transporting ATPase subunit b
MKRKLLSRLAAIAFLAFLFVGTLAAQDSASGAPSPTAEPAKTAPAATDPNAGDANAGIGEILAGTSEKAAHAAEKLGHSVGIGPKASYSISIAFNFIALFGIFYILMKSKLPQAFRDRTAAIQKGIKEAQAASADAARRLTDIEARLSKLDSEVEQIRAMAEREAAAEEARIRQAAEEDKQKVVKAAEAEIDAIARNARRELKGYAASLAVDMAAQKLRIDDSTDHALIREFAQQLGKDGK